MQYEQTGFFVEKKKENIVIEKHFKLNPLISWRKFKEPAS